MMRLRFGLSGDPVSGHCADAQMMKADWMGDGATVLGVLEVGFGLWWLDPLAAGAVSLSILHDGWKNLSSAVGDLIERYPMKTDQSGIEPLSGMVREKLK
jgi:divalent metal cation (Fe/Co/Zn/Cd) transporter